MVAGFRMVSSCSKGANALILLFGANFGVFSSMAQMKGLGGSGLYSKAQETMKGELVITKELFDVEASGASLRFLESHEEKKAQPKCADNDAALIKMVKESPAFGGSASGGGADVEGCLDPRVKNYCREGVWMLCPDMCGCCLGKAGEDVNPDGSGIEKVEEWCDMTDDGRPRMGGARVTSPKNQVNEEECAKCPEGPAGKPCRSAHCDRPQGFETTGPILVVFVTLFASVFGCGLFFMAAKSYKKGELETLNEQIKFYDEGQAMNAEACGSPGRRGPSGLGRAARHADGTPTFEAWELALRDPEAAEKMGMTKEVEVRKQQIIAAEMQYLEGRPSRDPETMKPTEEALALAMSNPEVAEKFLMTESVKRRLKRDELIEKKKKLEEDIANGIVKADDGKSKSIFEMFHDMDRKGKTTGNVGAVKVNDSTIAGG